jgi:CHAT domain-containing protein/Tfp pilus assembly protein PilF
MSRPYGGRWLIFVSLLGLGTLLQAQDKPQASASDSQTTPENAALQVLVEQYFAAYARKDLNGMMALWSPSSPDLAVRRQQVQELFTSSGDITLTHIEIEESLIEAEKAHLLVTFDLSVVDAETGKPMPDVGKITHSLQCVKLAGLWKIWHDSNAANDLATLVLAAKSEQERTVLLDGNPILATPYLVDTLVDEARGLQVRGEYDRALNVHKTAYGIATTISYKQGMARSLNNIGSLEMLNGEYIEAMQTLQRGLAIANALDDKTMVGRVLHNLGAIYLQQGNYSLALEHLHKSLQIAESIGRKWDIADVLQQVGDVYLLQNDFDEALTYYQRSLELFRKTGDKGRMAGSISGAAWACQLQGDSDKALRQFHEALAISEELGRKPRIAIDLYSIGALFLSRKDYEQTFSYFERSLKLSQELGDQNKIAYALGGLAEAHYAKGDFEMALDSANRVSTIARNIGAPDLLLEYRGIAGQAYRALHKPIEARSAFDEAITVVESMRENIAGGEDQQQRFFADKLDPYRGLVELLIADSQFSEALSYAERAKGRTLADVLGSGRVNVTKAMTAAEREREGDLQAELVSLNRQLGVQRAASKPDESRMADLKSGLDKARLQYSDFRTALYAAHPELRAQRGQIQPISLSDAANLLPDNRSAVLEFLVAEQKTYLFVLTRSAEGNVAIPELKVHIIDIKAKDLGQEAEQFRRQLSLRDLQFRPSALKLFKLLVQPAQPQLSGVTSLLIVPDGPLWNLPFQAVQPRQGHYLLEDYALSYAPSLTILREMVRLRLRNKEMPAIKAGQTLLAMGNPVLDTATSERAKLTYRDEKLAPLPEAAREVKTLESLYGRDQSRVFVGAEAAEDQFKAQAGQFRILHLATHGLLNDTSPMYSHLLLSSGGPSGKEDGLLEAWEVMNLDLHADLAVLSACETARGRITSGEGVVGLTWAFFVAGVPTALVSQWKVESTSTTELMLVFHRARKAADDHGNSGFGTARALQRAELQLLHDPQFSHPFYWAGFIVMGDPH